MASSPIVVRAARRRRAPLQRRRSRADGEVKERIRKQLL